MSGVPRRLTLAFPRAKLLLLVLSPPPLRVGSWSVQVNDVVSITFCHREALLSGFPQGPFRAECRFSE